MFKTTDLNEMIDKIAKYPVNLSFGKETIHVHVVEGPLQLWFDQSVWKSYSSHPQTLLLQVPQSAGAVEYTDCFSAKG